MSLRKTLETFIRFFPSSFNGKYVGPAHFVFNAYPGRNATCPLSSCSNKNDGPEVLTSFYGRFFVEEGQFIKYTPSTSSLHLGSHFFHLLTPPRFGALNLPEVNQFTGNCFRMVRIVLKITFLKLRACLHGSGGPQVGEVSRLGGVTRLSIQSVTRPQSSLDESDTISHFNVITFTF